MNINLTKTGATYNTNIGEQLDLLYHAIHADEFGSTAKTSTFYTELKAVKDKYPKS